MPVGRASNARGHGDVDDGVPSSFFWTRNSPRKSVAVIGPVHIGDDEVLTLLLEMAVCGSVVGGEGRTASATVDRLVSCAGLVAK